MEEFSRKYIFAGSVERIVIERLCTLALLPSKFACPKNPQPGRAPSAGRGITAMTSAAVISAVDKRNFMFLPVSGAKGMQENREGNGETLKGEPEGYRE